MDTKSFNHDGFIISPAYSTVANWISEIWSELDLNSIAKINKLTKINIYTIKLIKIKVIINYQIFN